MRLSINLQLPQRNLRVGEADMRYRSLVGFEGREYNRYFPVIKALEFLTSVNVWQWKRLAMEGKRPPLLYQSGVRYEAEPNTPVAYIVQTSSGIKWAKQPPEEWMDFPTLYERGVGDCEDLACARAGELQYNGIAAVPAIRSKQIGQLTLIHVLVLWPDGQIEDPSAALGMKGEY